MKRQYVKRLKEYENVEFQADKILEALKSYRSRRKKPTSVALEERTVFHLKALAEWQGIPYQALMRNFILEGLRRSLASFGREQRRGEGKG